MYPCYIAPRLTGIPPEHEQTSGRAVHPAAWRLAPGLRSLHQCDNRTNLRSFSFVLLTAGPQALAHGAKDLNLLSEAGGLLRTPFSNAMSATKTRALSPKNRSQPNVTPGQSPHVSASLTE